MPITAIITKSPIKTKKYKVVIYQDKRKIKTIHFGGAGYSDYTQHKMDGRKTLYITRHRARENWTRTGYRTAGFWSKHLLWNKPTLRESVRDIERKFKIKVSMSL